MDSHSYSTGRGAPLNTATGHFVICVCSVSLYFRCGLVYSCGNATLALLVFSYVPDEMGLGFPSPFALEMDSDAARIFSKMKHIDCHQHWARRLRNRNIRISAHSDTKSDLAGLFDKILDTPTFGDQLLKPYIIKNAKEISKDEDQTQPTPRKPSSTQAKLPITSHLACGTVTRPTEC